MTPSQNESPCDGFRIFTLFSGRLPWLQRLGLKPVASGAFPHIRVHDAVATPLFTIKHFCAPIFGRGIATHLDMPVPPSLAEDHARGAKKCHDGHREPPSLRGHRENVEDHGADEASRQ